MVTVGMLSVLLFVSGEPFVHLYWNHLKCEFYLEEKVTLQLLFPTVIVLTWNWNYLIGNFSLVCLQNKNLNDNRRRSQMTERVLAEATACNTYSLRKKKESILNQLHF